MTQIFVLIDMYTTLQKTNFKMTLKTLLFVFIFSFIQDIMESQHGVNKMTINLNGETFPGYKGALSSLPKKKKQKNKSIMIFQ